MKRKLILAGCLLALLTFGMLFHFGPLGIRPGDDRLLAQLALRRGDRLYLVAHRTGNAIDAYEVSLYRVDPGTNVLKYYLGHEDSYWWGSSLSSLNNEDAVDIAVYWGRIARYSVAADEVSWIDGKAPKSPPRSVAPTGVPELLATEEARRGHEIKQRKL